MAEDIHVQCFKCKTVYELDAGFRGKLVECAVCDIVFTVPRLGEKRPKSATEKSNSHPDPENDREENNSDGELAVEAGTPAEEDTESIEPKEEKKKWWQLGKAKKK